MSPSTPRRRRVATSLGLIAWAALASPVPALFIEPSWSQDATVGRLKALRGPAPTPGSLPTVPAPQNPSQTTGGSMAFGDWDRDGDGLADVTEIAGWDIVYDEHGYGPTASIDLLTIVSVSSKANDADSDDDGLGDLEEYLIGTNPLLKDTDGDGLTDDVEWYQWLTSPNSIDTDGDARGPDGNLAPNAMLFDGMELNAIDGLAFEGVPRTSPTLADTDGDGMTDFEELGHPFFSPIVANLPQSAVEIAGDPTVRLDVEYVETVGQATEYGSTLSTSQSETSGQSWGSSIQNTISNSLSLGYEYSWKEGSSASVEYNFTHEHSWESSHELSQEATQETAEEHSRYQSDSLDLTESAASGFISVPIRLRNTGDFAFTLTSLGLSVLKWTPPLLDEDDELIPGRYEAMATLTPGFGDLTLAPGEATPILMVDAEDVNADVIKGFMGNPASLVLAPSVYNMVTEDGIDFDFVTELTHSRTALLEIVYGPDDVELYRVATNVDRDGFSYEGISLAEVLQTVAGMHEDLSGAGGPDSYTLKEVNIPQQGGGPGTPTGLFTPASIRGKSFVPGEGVDDPPEAFWVTLGDNLPVAAFDLDGDGQDDMQVADFHATRLHAGDVVRLEFTFDDDGDWLYASQERQFGTSDQDPDSDVDGLDDRLETQVGFEIDLAGATGELAQIYPRLVYTNPLLIDTDNDGLTDREEIEETFTDPTHVDTDRDAIPDLDDVFPTIPAARFYVTADGDPGASGLSWGQAKTLQGALTEAQARNTDRDDSNDIGEIWVARSTYVLTSHTDTFQLPLHTTVLGGFFGDELLASERDPDPATNQTVLSGQFSLLPGSNAWSVVSMPAASQAETGPGSSTLDGFVITGGDSNSTLKGGGIYSAPGSAHGVFRNLLIQQNEAETWGGGAWLGSPAVFEDCVFQSNQAVLGGGLAVGDGIEQGDVVLRDCRLRQNIATDSGGGLYNPTGSALSLVRTQVESNRALGGPVSGGGGWRIDGGGHATSSEIVGNQSGDLSQLNYSGAGGIDLTDASPDALVLVNTMLASNDGGEAGGLYTLRPAVGEQPRLIQLTNCTVVDNMSWAVGDSGLTMVLPEIFGSFPGYTYWATGCGGIFQRTPSENFASGRADVEPSEPSNLFVITNSVLYGNRNGVAASGLTEQYPSNVFGGLKHGAWAQIRTTSGHYPGTGVFNPLVIGEDFHPTLIPPTWFDEYYWGDSLTFLNSAIEWSGSYQTPVDDQEPFLKDVLQLSNLVPSVSEWAEAGVAFVDYLGGDYRPVPGSPLVDGGLTVVDTDLTTLLFDLLPGVDLDGNPRIVGSDESPVVDMGAYELQLDG